MFWRKKKKFNLYQDDIEFVDLDDESVSEEKPEEEKPADDIEENPAAETEFSGEDQIESEEIPAEDTSAEGEPLAEDTYAGEENSAADTYASEDTPAADIYVKEEDSASDAYAEEENSTPDTFSEEENFEEYTVSGGYDTFAVESDTAVGEESSGDDSTKESWAWEEDDAASEEELTGEGQPDGEHLSDGELPGDQESEGETGEADSESETEEKKKVLGRFSIPFGKKRKHDKSVKDKYEDASFDDADWKQTKEKKEKKLSRKKLAVIAVGIIVVLAIVVSFIMRLLGNGDESKAYVESVAEITGLGTANGMSNRYTGEVEAQDSWKITLQQDLSVSECYVHVGDEVKEGDKLFSYNTEELKLNKEKKELEVETLTNEINQLKKDIVEYQNDLRNASASEKIELQTQILTAQTTIKKDEFTIKSSKDDIESLEKNIKDATITSKMTGVVKKINASLGSSSGDDSDDSGISDGSGDDAYMTILALGSYRVKGKISETNVWQINEGDPVIVRSRVDDTTWKGSIEQVKTDTNADSDSQNSDDLDYDMGDSSGENASNYNFFVKLDDDKGLMMGQHVLIEIDKGQDDDKTGIWLNSAYLHIDGDNYYVWLSTKKDRLTLRKVEVGDYNEELDEYEILSGLALTDFIAADSEELRENMKTTKVNPEEDSTENYDNEEVNDDSLYDNNEGNDDFMFEDDSDSSSDDDAIVIDDGQGLGPDNVDDSGDSSQNSL